MLYLDDSIRSAIRDGRRSDNLRFRLELTSAEIRTRCEVRYCLPGIGVGVEFIDISPQSVRKIEREVELCKRSRPRRKTVKTG